MSGQAQLSLSHARPGLCCAACLLERRLLVLPACSNARPPDCLTHRPPGVQVGARVVSASYGGPGYSELALDAIDQLGRNGTLFVAAAGNGEGPGHVQ